MEDPEMEGKPPFFSHQEARSLDKRPILTLFKLLQKPAAGKRLVHCPMTFQLNSAQEP